MLRGAASRWIRRDPRVAPFDPMPVLRGIDLRKWRPDVPEKLIAVINQACSKDPKSRYDDAEHFAKVLRTFTIPLASVGAGSKGGMPVSSGPALSGYVLMSESGMMPARA